MRLWGEVTRLYVTAERAPAPGDIRALGRGDEIVFHESSRSRGDFFSLACALVNAFVRGAEIRWEEPAP